MENQKGMGSREQIEIFVLTKHQANLGDAKANAIAFCEAKASKEQIETCASNIELLYEGLQVQVEQKLQAHTMRVCGALDMEVWERERRNNNAKIREAESQVRIFEDEKRRLPKITYDWSSEWSNSAIKAGFFGAEICVNMFALANLGGPLIMSFLPAIAVGLALFITASYIGRMYAKKVGKERRTFGIQAASLMLIVFCGLAILRSLSMINNGEWHWGWNMAIASFAYIAINSLVFFSSIVFSTTSATTEDRLLRDEHTMLDAKISDANAQIDSCKKENEAIDRESDTVRKSYIDVAGDEAHFAHLIRAYCNETLMAFFREITIRNPQAGYVFIPRASTFHNPSKTLS